MVRDVRSIGTRLPTDFSCEIKSGSGLGMRLEKYYFHTYKVNMNHTPFMNILKSSKR